MLTCADLTSDTIRYDMTGKDMQSPVSDVSEPSREHNFRHASINPMLVTSNPRKRQARSVVDQRDARDEQLARNPSAMPRCRDAAMPRCRVIAIQSQVEISGSIFNLRFNLRLRFSILARSAESTCRLVGSPFGVD